VIPSLLLHRSLIGFAVSCLLSPGSAAAADAEKVAFFESRIRPVLVEKCYSCHSVEAKAKGKLKGGLYMDSRAGLLAGASRPSRCS
jgi:hypothetical protein